MINERSLRDVLVVLTEQAKMQQYILSIVMDEVAALRETVRGLDPTFGEVFQARRDRLSSEEFRQLADKEFDALIERLRGGEVC